MAVVGRDRQDQHARVRGCLGQAAGGLDASDAGHVEVHHHHVRSGRLHQLERGLPARGLPHDVEAPLAQQVAQALTEEVVVVDDDDLDVVALPGDPILHARASPLDRGHSTTDVSPPG
jgi:hypothetical protein